MATIYQRPLFVKERKPTTATMLVRNGGERGRMGEKSSSGPTRADIQREFNERITAELRVRFSATCATSKVCAECDSFYVPDSRTAHGLCHFCTEALVLR